MKGKKAVYIALLAGGIIILVLALAADYIGIGGGVPQFGTRQIVGVVVGVIVTAAGLILTLRK